MWSYYFKQYSCNPRYLTEFLLENNPEYEIYWIFRKNVDIFALIDGVIEAADEMLKKTPEMLPVLKEAGVVDAGGYGFVCLLAFVMVAYRQGRAFVRAEDTLGLSGSVTDNSEHNRQRDHDCECDG